jgi:hypothetical protein
VADLVRRLVEPGVPVVLVAACLAPQRHVTHAPALALGLACWFADAGQPADFLRQPGESECPYGQCSGLLAKSGTGIR